MKKRLLSWLLAISMLTAAMPTAFAEGDAAATEPAPVSMSDVTEEHSEPAGDVIVGEEETEPETPEDTSEEPAADSTVASVPTETDPAEQPSAANGIALLSDEEQGDPVCTDGTAQYTTLAQAFNDAPDGSTITLTDDFTVPAGGIATVPEGKTLTLDLSTHTISVTGDFVGRPIVNNGTLTVKGEGAIDASASVSGGYGAINNYGTLTIESGNFKGSVLAGGACVYVRPGSTATINGGTFSGATAAINSEGDLTIHGGTFSTTSCNQTKDENGKSYWAYCIISSGTLHITDAHVTGVQGALAINNGYAVVDGGTYRTVGCTHDKDGPEGLYSYYALYIAGEEGVVEAHINGGTYTAAYRSAVLAGNDNPGGDGGINAKATAYITGGTFNGGPAGEALSAGKNTGDPQITGGTFNTDISAYVAPGSIQKDSDGKFVVRALTAEDPETLAEVDGVYYDDLGEALAAAADSKTVVLQKDVTLSASVSAAGTSVLDLNGHTVQAADDLKIMFEVETGANLTVRGKDGFIKGGANTLLALNVHGTLNVESGTIETPYGIQARDSVVNVTGGTINATKYGILAFGGSVSLSGEAVIDAGNGGVMQASGTKVDISGNVQLSGETGVDVFNYAPNNDAGNPSSTVTMTGGSITCKYFAIDGNNLQSAGATVNITGGTLTCDKEGVAIYWPMEGTLTIGGTAKVSGGTAIEAKMGTITIKDQAVIEGTGDYNENEPQNGGSSPEGSALLFSAQMYGGVNTQYRTSPDLTVNIEGGTLKSVNGNAVTVYNTESTDVQTAKVTVSGGTMEYPEGKAAIRSYTSGGNDAGVTGDGLTTTKSKTTVEVKNTAAAAATDANGVTLYYTSVDTALAAAGSDPVEVFVFGESDVSVEMLDNENVTLTVADGVNLYVGNGTDDMVLQATKNADGSTSYKLVDKTGGAVTVDPPIVTLTADKTSATEGETITLTAKATHTNDKVTEYSYAWYKDGVLIPGQTGSTLTVTSAGNYTVGVRAKLADENDASIVYLSGERVSAAMALTFTPRPGQNPPVDEHPEIGEAIANGTWGQPDSAPAASSNSTAAGSTSVSVPQTSDDANLTLWIVLLAVSAVAIVVLGVVIYRRRKGSK
ncbi:MAG TPA: hypothetical protein H9860_11310 [Candidatus Gemmiger faecavium]|nr:hypothetical protein [Candidatus Gemmiger faecavium]